VRFRRFGVPDELRHTVGSQTYLRGLCGDLEDLVLSLLRPPIQHRAAWVGSNGDAMPVGHVLVK
jgi:hypothetical protein